MNTIVIPGVDVYAGLDFESLLFVLRRYSGRSWYWTPVRTHKKRVIRQKRHLRIWDASPYAQPTVGMLVCFFVGTRVIKRAICKNSEGMWLKPCQRRKSYGISHFSETLVMCPSERLWCFSRLVFFSTCNRKWKAKKKMQTITRRAFWGIHETGKHPLFLKFLIDSRIGQVLSEIRRQKVQLGEFWQCFRKCVDARHLCDQKSKLWKLRGYVNM